MDCYGNAVKEIEQLKKENQRLSDANLKLAEINCDLARRNNKLRDQIKVMRCCYNCTGFEVCDDDEISDCAPNNLKNWEYEGDANEH